MTTKIGKYLVFSRRTFPVDSCSLFVYLFFIFDFEMCHNIIIRKFQLHRFRNELKNEKFEKSLVKKKTFLPSLFLYKLNKKGV